MKKCVLLIFYSFELYIGTVYFVSQQMRTAFLASHLLRRFFIYVLFCAKGEVIMNSFS